MTDLAQHAAQVAIWHGWDDPGFDYSAHFWVNWRTPYLLSNFCAYLLSFVFSVATAFKIVYSLALVAIPWATLALLRESGGRPAWAFLVVPAGYGFSFYMGFVAFALAVPAALLFVALAWRYAREPKLSRALALFAGSQLLFLTHTIAFGWAGLSAALLIAALAPRLRSIPLRWLPLLLALVLPLVWLVAAMSYESQSQVGDAPWFDPTRILRAISFTAGQPVGWPGLILGATLLALPFAVGRPSRRLARWLPLAVAVVFFVLTTTYSFGTAYLHQRFAAFFLPCLLFAMDPPQRSNRPVHAWLMPAVAGIWLAYVQIQCLAFRAETGAFGSILKAREPHRLVLYLPLDFQSQETSYPTYFGTWYQVEKGGIVDYSFGHLFLNRFRFRPEAEPALADDPDWQPRHFDWQKHRGERYDYILIRSWRDPAPFLYQARAPVIPIARGSGGWWLYEPVPDGARR